MKARTIAAIAAVLVSTLLFMGQTGRAHAYDEWCFDDPVIQVGPYMLETTVGVLGDPTFVHAHVTSATITYYLPVGVHGEKVKSTTTPSFPEHVVFATSDVTTWKHNQPMPVTVTVSFVSNVPLQAQMVNTTQIATKGPQQAPKQGAWVSTAFGSTSAGVSATGALVKH